MLRTSLPSPVLLVTALLLSGCAGATASRDAAPPPDGADLQEVLRREVARWLGTPHRWGGLDRGGVDCSGFVYRVFSDAFLLDLPRSTSGQVRAGRQVRRGDLRAGDLVFFRTGRKTRHVGIYLGQGRFAHASSSQGVTESDLDARYWRRTYWTARRVLGRAHRPAPSRPAAPPSPGRRGGW